MSIDDELSAAIASIYDAGLDADLWPSALAKVNELTGSRGSHLLLFTKDEVLPLFGVLQGHDEDANQEYADHYAAIDERWPRVLAMPSGDIRQHFELLTEEEMATSACFNEYQARHDAQQQAVSRIDIAPNMNVILALTRKLKDVAFDQTDVRIYRNLLQHIQRAVQINVKLESATGLVNTFEANADTLNHGVIVLDEYARIVFMNRMAREIANERDAFLAGPDGFSAIRPRDDRRLQECIATAIAVSRGTMFNGGGQLTFLRRHALRPYSVVISPLNRGDQIFASARPAVVILIGNPDATPKISTPMLCDLFGLTRREAEVATLVASGMKGSDTAKALGIAPRTAQIHLQRVFSKTGTNGQAQLVKLLLTYPLGGK